MDGCMNGWMNELMKGRGLDGRADGWEYGVEKQKPQNLNNLVIQ